MESGFSLALTRRSLRLLGLLKAIIGTKMAPSYANIFMGRLEKQLLQSVSLNFLLILFGSSPGYLLNQNSMASKPKSCGMFE